MKNSRVHLTLIAVGMAVLFAGMIVGAQQNDPAAALLDRGIQKQAGGDLKEAMAIFNEVVSKYPASVVAPSALLRLAEVQGHVAQEEAQKTYKRLIGAYPKSREAEIARSQVEDRSLGPLSESKVCVGCGSGRGNGGPVSADGQQRPVTGSGGLGIQELRSGQVTRLVPYIFGQGVGPDGRIGGTNIDSFTDLLLSPDQRQLVYLYEVEGRRGKYRRELRVMPVEVNGTPSVLAAYDYDIVNPPAGIEKILAWKPDGKSILALATLESTSVSRKQLVWIAVSDGTVKPLKTIDYRMSWGGGQSASVSPDGRYVAYPAFPGNPKSRPTVNERNSLGRHIYVIAADGSGSEFDVASAAGINDSPNWTPDGSHVLFVRDSDLWATPVKDGKPVGPPVRVAGNVNRPIGVGGSNLYVERRAPQTKQILQAEMKEGGAKVKSGARLLTEVNTSVLDNFFGLAASPDGREVAFPSGSNLVVFAVEGARQVASFRGGSGVWFHNTASLMARAEISSPDSPDIRQAALAQTSLCVISRLDFNGKSEELVRLASSAEYCGLVALSQDDKTAYIVLIQYGRQVVAELVQLDVTTGKEKSRLTLPGTGFDGLHLTPNGQLVRSGTGFDLQLSPDGHTLAWWSGGNSDARVAQVETNGAGYRELSAIPITEHNGQLTLAWTADSKSLLFNQCDKDGNCRIMRTPADVWQPETTGLEAKGLTTFVLSADGSRIIYSRTASPGSLDTWALDLRPLMKK